MSTEPIDHTTSSASRWSGLRERAISGAVMAAIMVTALWAGGWWFTLLVVACAIIMIREWDALTADDHPLAKCIGVFYVGVPCASLIWMRNLSFPDAPNGGIALVVFVILIVVATDIGAYFTGRRVGGPKLAPRISPSKTWAGLGGGIVCAAIAGAIGSVFSPYPPSAFAGLDLGILLALIAQGGDLFESWLKRRVGVKDSGTLIPGHGGLLDRVDGMIFTLPVFALFLHFAS